MKKIIALLLALTLLLCATGCRTQKKADVTEAVLAEFTKIAVIPRASGHEEQIGAYLLKWADEHGFKAARDDVGNVVFDIPATKGREALPLTVLQGHMDMVAISDDPSFDPLTDAIKPVRVGDTLTADGTTLGADDGIGVAVILTYAASDAEHGPLRAIITVHEENDLVGVHGLDPTFVRDAAFLINLDNEYERSACVSAAASDSLLMTAPSETTKPIADTALSLHIHGLKGGHSGININSGRINAITALAELLLALERGGVEYELASFTGGTVQNAIPIEAEAIIAVADKDAQAVKALVAEQAAALQKTFASTDGGVLIDVAPVALPQLVLTEQTRDAVVSLAALLPNGVGTMSQLVEGLVESSSSLGVIKADAEGLALTTYIRSSQDLLQKSILLRQTRLAELLGFSCEAVHGSDAWPVDADAKLPGLLSTIYKEQTGKELVLESVHAGLECGTFALMNESIDMASIGPQIDNAHTTSETLHIPTVTTLCELLWETLARIG